MPPTANKKGRMKEENNEFKGFVKSEIKNVRDAAQRNYDEHVTIFGALSEIRVTLGKLEERLDAIAETKRAKYGAWAAFGGVLLIALAALIKSMF